MSDQPVTDHVVSLLHDGDKRPVAAWNAECTCGEKAIGGTEAQARRWKLQHIKAEWAKRNKAGWYHPGRYADRKAAR